MLANADHSSVVLYRAPWVIPVSSPIIIDGVIVVKEGRITAVGPWQDLSACYSKSRIVKCSGVLMPGLVNAHIHLELSAFGVVSQKNAESTMCDWVRNLLQKRMAGELSEEEIHFAAEQCARDQFNSGVVALLDTGNTILPKFSGNIPEITSLLELLGPSAKATQTALETLDDLPETVFPTGHAPYSTSPVLLQSIKQQATEKKSVFSLHVEENRDEALLLLFGSGCFYDFLQERDALDGTFPLTANRYKTVIDYLNQMQILDAKTVCVHCVCVSEEDIQILANVKSHVCLCPGSNKFLRVGKAPLEAFLARGILPALGTDSLASNPEISMWHEISLCRKEYPNVASEIILAMATIAGAKAIGRESDYGSLETGKSANFLGIEDEKISTAASEKEVLDILTSIEKPEKVLRLGKDFSGC
jgi:aminodeoxyfutalosine deaminase